jgi:VWFA-related protein
VKRWILALAVCGICTSTLPAQLKVDVSLVTLQATVTDRTGRYVYNLGPGDFILSEDGKEQKIALVEQSDDAPLTIGVLLDTSSSMRSKINTATSAIDRFLRSLRSDDDMFLMTFAGRTNVAQNFTSDRSRISKALKNVNLSFGTVLYEAIEQGIVKLRDGKHPKKVILLVTDGQDYGSRIRLQQAIDDVRESSVLLYCLGIGAYASNSRGRYPGGTPDSNPASGPQPSPPNSGPDGGRNGSPTVPSPGVVPAPFPGDGPMILRQFPIPGLQGGRYPSPSGRSPGATRGSSQDSADILVLDNLASASGGKALLVTTKSSINSHSIDEALDEISSELRSQYTIGYYPDHPPGDGKWHQVVVNTRNTSYSVRSRKEYLGGQPSR